MESRFTTLRSAGTAIAGEENQDFRHASYHAANKSHIRRVMCGNYLENAANIAYIRRIRCIKWTDSYINSRNGLISNGIRKNWLSSYQRCPIVQDGFFVAWTV